MSRYIDADKLIEYANNTKDKTIDANDIARFPAADVRENVRGEWTDFSMSIKGVPTEACGVCGEWSLGMGKNFCPNCGASMRGDNDV